MKRMFKKRSGNVDRRNRFVRFYPLFDLTGDRGPIEELLSRYGITTFEDRIKTLVLMINDPEMSRTVKKEAFNTVLQDIKNIEHPDEVNETVWFTVLRLYRSKYLTSKDRARLHETLSRIIGDIGSDRVKMYYLFYDCEITGNNGSFRRLFALIKKLMKEKRFTVTDLSFTVMKLNKKSFTKDREKQTKKLVSLVDRFIRRELENGNNDLVSKFANIGNNDEIFKKYVLRIASDRTVVTLLEVLLSRSNVEDQHDFWLRRFLIVLSSYELRTRSSRIWNLLKKRRNAAPLIKRMNERNKEVMEYIKVLFTCESDLLL